MTSSQLPNLLPSERELLKIAEAAAGADVAYVPI